MIQSSLPTSAHSAAATLRESPFTARMLIGGELVEAPPGAGLIASTFRERLQKSR